MTIVEAPEHGAPRDPKKPTGTSENPDSPKTPAGTNRKRVLIVEDNTDAGRVLTAMVTRMGHDVEYAVNGNVGLAYTKLFKPDVILLDLNLPGMNGYEVCKRVKEDPSTSHARVIIVSAYGDAETQARAKAAGAALYLVKPVEWSVLEQLLSF